MASLNPGASAQATGAQPPALGAKDQAWKRATSDGAVPVDWRRYVAAALVLFLIAVLIAQVGSEANKGFVDGAAVLAMVSLVAVGIERAIEAFWSITSRWKDAWWPLNEIGQAVTAQVASMNLAVRPVFDSAVDELTKAKELLNEGDAGVARISEQIAAVQQQRDAFIGQVQKINALAKDGQRVNLIATAAIQASSRVDAAIGKEIPAVREAFNDATIVATGAVDLLAGFKDNPAKKMVSLALGMGMGLIVAGFLRLDLFAAAGAPLAAGWKFGDTVLLPFVGVAVTGIVLGLGSNPTHQVVSWATDVAKARKTAALGVPETADGVSAPPVGPALPGGIGAALLAAAKVGTRETLPDSTNVRVPGERFIGGAGTEALNLGNEEVEVNLGGLYARDMLRWTDSGRKILTMPGRAVAEGAGRDPAAAHGHSVAADMTGISVPHLDDVTDAVSPPRVRPVTMNLRRR